MNTPRRRLSPSNFAAETGLDVKHSAYHFAELADAGCIVLVGTKPRRGAVEHIYEPRETALAWTSEWTRMSPRIKRGVLRSVMGGAVEALGSAIDSGTFEARDDSHLSWNTIEVDGQGWVELTDILDGALKRLLVVGDEAERRIEEGADGFLASYFMAGFESPSKVDALDGFAAPVEGLLPRPETLRPTKDPTRSKRREARKGKSDEEIMAKVMSHPTRVRILMAMNTPRRRLSSRLFSNETGLPIQHCAYHFGELEDTGCISLVATRKRRGAIENIYEPRKAAIQWTDQWRHLGPAVKQTFLASVMRGAVEALGAAIEDGTFEARDDSHLASNTLNIDAKGWSDVAAILDDALIELIEMDRRVLERIAGGAEIFVASYLMASFESPPKMTALAE